MKTTLGAFVVLLLTATVCAQPAHAQQAPQGFYLNSCRNVGMDGDRLIADCRRPDGGWHRTALDVDRCAGDIANIRGAVELQPRSARRIWLERKAGLAPRMCLERRAGLARRLRIEQPGRVGVGAAGALLAHTRSL